MVKVWLPLIKVDDLEIKTNFRDDKNSFFSLSLCPTVLNQGGFVRLA